MPPPRVLLKAALPCSALPAVLGALGVLGVLGGFGGFRVYRGAGFRVQGLREL